MQSRRFYLKFSRVNSCVISLNSSSLKDANTFKSLTKISTALDRSCLAEKETIVMKAVQHLQSYKDISSPCTYLSRASRYFCLRISKNIFIE